MRQIIAESLSPTPLPDRLRKRERVVMMPRIRTGKGREGIPCQCKPRGVQVAVLLGSYFGTHLVLKVSNFPEKIVSEGDEHRLARQKAISA